MESPSTLSRWVLLAGCLISLGLTQLPARQTGLARTLVLDLLEPGQRVLLSIETQLALREPPDVRVAELERQVTEQDQRLRTLQAQNVELLRRVAEQQAGGPYQPQASEPLVTTDLLEARVLGQGNGFVSDEGLLLSQGQWTGVGADLLVLEPESMWQIDQGEPQQVATGQPVYAGRVVLGRIAEAGRWTSRVQSVSSPDYRARAQLVQLHSQGPRLGAEGILEGLGNGQCRLQFIPATEPVQVGDHVYTAGGSGVLNVPLYYGQIVRAELRTGEPHWDISVQPAAASLRPTTVQVLRHQVNPERTAELVRPSEPQTQERSDGVSGL